FVAQLYSVLSRGVTLGERLVLIAAVQVRRPVLLGRSLRFLFGIGGHLLLSPGTVPRCGPPLFPRVARSAVPVFTARPHRGLACVLSGTAIDDVTARDTLAPGRLAR